MKLFDRRGTPTLPEEDYKILLEEATGLTSVLEFGPGYSTYAFIEAGVKRILSCEYLEEWLESAKERFKDYPQVEIRPYWNKPEAEFEGDGEDEQFDLALVDSPKGYTLPRWMKVPDRLQGEGRVAHPGQEDCSRLNTCLLALKHAPVVLLHDAFRPLEKATLGRLNAMGHKVTPYEKSAHRTGERLPGHGLARIDRCQKPETSLSSEPSAISERSLLDRLLRPKSMQA